MCQRYIAPTRFKRLDQVTQQRRRALLEATFDELTEPGVETVFADLPSARLKPAAIRILRDREADVPDGANNTVAANGVVGPVHSKAMPVLLTKPEEWATWLESPTAEAPKLQRPLPDGAMCEVAWGERRYGPPEA